MQEGGGGARPWAQEGACVTACHWHGMSVGPSSSGLCARGPGAAGEGRQPPSPVSLGLLAPGSRNLPS